MVIYKLFNAKGDHVASTYEKPSRYTMNKYNATRFDLFHVEQSKPKKYKAPEYMLHL